MLDAINEKWFKAMSETDIKSLMNAPKNELRILLPSLVRMSLCPLLDESKECKDLKNDLMMVLLGIKEVNTIVSLLSVNFHALKEDLSKEQKIRSKVSPNEKALLNIKHGLIKEFEQGDSMRKFYLVVSEIIPLISALHDPAKKLATDGNGYALLSELFMCPPYLQIVSDVLCIAHAELPSLLPLTRLAESLIYVQNGSKILCKLIANFPDSFLSVCQHLVKHGREDFGSAKTGSKSADENRKEAVEMLCRMNKDMSLNIRAFTVQYCKLPSLAISLTLDYANTNDKSNRVSDLVTFVSGLLLGNNVKTRSWFALYIKTAPEESRFRRELEKELRSIVDNAALDCEMLDAEKSSDIEKEIDHSMCILTEEQCLRATALIRLCCALRAISGLKFSKVESDLVLRLITCYPPLTPAGICFMSLALSMLLACSSVIAGEQKEAIAIKWIKWLASRSAELQDAGPEGGSFAEQLLLLAIHLHNDKRQAVVQLVCSTLGMRVKVSSSSLVRLRQIFTEEVFTTQVIAAHAAIVPVTKNLNGSMTSYLPVHCVYQLLKSRAFSKSKVSIKSWVYKQVCTTTMPLHYQLHQLVAQYVSTVVTPHTKGHKGGMLNDPLTEEEILEVFSKKSKYSLTTQLLILYYVLLYQDSLLTNMKTVVTLPNPPQMYPTSLINQIPVKLLLHYAQRHPASCEGLYPSLLGLLVNQLPHLCQVEDWITDLASVPFTEHQKARNTSLALSQQLFNVNPKSVSQTLCTPEQLSNGLSHADVNPALSLSYLRDLTSLKLNPEKTIPYAKALTSGLPKLLEPEVSRRVKQESCKLWLRLNGLIPRRMWVLTANALRPPMTVTGIGHRHDVTLDEIVEDPLLLLACDNRVFRCPEILAILLRMLNACLSASHAHFSALVLANPSSTKSNSPNPSSSGRSTPSTQVPDAEKEELRIALLAAQDSAAIQMLIEGCLPVDSDIQESNMFGPDQEAKESDLNLLSSLREVRCLVCSMIHQMFIADPSVAKLVHFQGYPSTLIPVLVSGVPSMHICMDFIPELLQQPDIAKKLFAIQLCSNLCEHYPLPKSLSLARLCLNVLATLVTVVSIHQRCSYFSLALSPMKLFARVFPPLIRYCVSILLHLSRLCDTYITAHDPAALRQSVAGDNKDSRSTLQTRDAHVNLRQNVQQTFKEISRYCAYKQ